MRVKSTTFQVYKNSSKEHSTAANLQATLKSRVN